MLSARAYDGLADRADLVETLAMIRRSEADLDAGRARDARDVIAGIAKQRGIPFDR